MQHLWQLLLPLSPGSCVGASAGFGCPLSLWKWDKWPWSWSVDRGKRAALISVFWCMFNLITWADGHYIDSWRKGRKLGLGTSGLSAEHRGWAGCRGGEKHIFMLCGVCWFSFSFVFFFFKVPPNKIKWRWLIRPVEMIISLERRLVEHRQDGAEVFAPLLVLKGGEMGRQSPVELWNFSLCCCY